MKKPEKWETRCDKAQFASEKELGRAEGRNEACDSWEEYHEAMMIAKDDIISFNKMTEKDVKRAELENDKLRLKIYDLNKTIKEKNIKIEQQTADIVEYRNEAANKGD